MLNGLGIPQSVVLFGGTSDIGQAILREYVQTGMSHVVLASRDTAATAHFAEELRQQHQGLMVHIVPFDATNPHTMVAVAENARVLCGDIDVAIVAQAQLGDGVDFFENPSASIDLSTVNYTSTIALMLALARTLREQRYGTLMLLSSVAGERVRKSNAVYGATKAGVDAFALALDHELSESGGRVLVVRPGFVKSKMTEGLEPVPFSTTPEVVARKTVWALAKNKRVVWVPGILRWVMVVFRHLPTFAWRRLPM